MDDKGHTKMKIKDLLGKYEIPTIKTFAAQPRAQVETQVAESQNDFDYEQFLETVRMLRLAGRDTQADRLMSEAPITTGSGGTLTTGSGAPVQSGTAAPAADAAAAAKAKLSPEQLKWLGGADPTDPAIMARLKKAVPDKPAGGAAAQPAAAAPAAAAPTDTAGAYDDEGNMMPGWSKDENGNPVKVADQGGKTFVEPATQALADKGRQAATQKANGVDANGNNVTMAGGINPETGTPTTVATAPAGGAAAQPAKPAAPAKPAFKADPMGQSIASQLKMTTPDSIKLFQKNNGLNPDGQIGPATTKALQAAAQKMGLTVASGVGTSTAGAGRGGVGGPTAAQLASAPAAGAAAQPAKPAPSVRGGPMQKAAPVVPADKRTPAEIAASKSLAGGESIQRDNAALESMLRIAGLR